MIRALVKCFLLVICAVCLLGTAFPNSTHKMPLGGSKWNVGKNGIIATIDLNELLFSEISGINEKHYNYESCSEQQLNQVATDFIQPYINKKISVSVNGKTYPVTVTKLVRHDNSIYTIWLSINNIAFERPQNVLKIEYKLLFNETNNEHVNLAYFYRSEATGDALQKLFDNYPAEGQHDFTGDSPAWELLVKGTSTAPRPLPPVGSVREKK